MSDVCQKCGAEYESIGQHWSKSTNCSHPSFTSHQREIITGLLMGDGTINRSEEYNPFLKSDMISPNYLEYVDEELGVFGMGVSLYRTAEENARNSRESGFSTDAESKNYSDVYRWYSMRHPELKELEDWYSSGEKIWPTDIELTPTVLKHWYCCDGHWDNSGTHNSIQIGMANEAGNTEKVDVMFQNAGLPAPSNYNTSGLKCTAQFRREQSEELWKYMGEPLPDFEYKWPEEYRRRTTLR